MTKHFPSPRRAPALTPFALAAAILAAAPFAAPFAHADEALPTIVVTGARFASDPALLPIGASVITADDMRRAGSTDVNQAIRKLGGVLGRQSLDGSPDFTLDLRGFGSNSAQNMVILVDGVRLSENELSNAVLSAIPIDTVERIEIARGGASVLFGEGATGGVIQIFSKRPKADGATHGSLFAELGQLGQRDVRASVARSIDALSLDAAVGGGRTDNDRAHNEFKQHSFSGGAQWRTAGGRVGLRAESARQDSQFPGSLTQAQYDADAHQSFTPRDGGSLHSERYTAFIEQRVGAFDLVAELSHREKNVKSVYYFSYQGVSSPSKAAYDSKQTQFSPRLRQLTQLDGMLNEFVAGIDLIDWKRVTTADFSAAKVEQQSKAVYLRDEIKWDAAHDGRLAIGARHEVFDKDSVDALSYDTSKQASSQSQNGWEAQGSYRPLALLNAYAKAGQSYRVANADENGYRTSLAVLKVQTSHDLEVGATLGDDARQATLRVFRHKLDNEIFFDPTGYGANVNLDPTRRQGVELEARARIDAAWTASAQWQHVKADFTDGPHAGKEMVLVPKNTLSARLAWTMDGQSADLGAQWVDSQRFGDDFANSCSTRMPAYTTLDGRYARKLGAWELAVAGLNLADRKYYSNAYGCRAGIYPSDGRQLKVSARYDF